MRGYWKPDVFAQGSMPTRLLNKALQMRHRHFPCGSTAAQQGNRSGFRPKYPSLDRRRECLRAHGAEVGSVTSHAHHRDIEQFEPSRARLAKILIDASGHIGVCYDKRGHPMECSVLVYDQKFQDCVLAEKHLPSRKRRMKSSSCYRACFADEAASHTEIK